MQRRQRQKSNDCIGEKKAKNAENAIKMRKAQQTKGSINKN